MQSLSHLVTVVVNDYAYDTDHKNGGVDRKKDHRCTENPLSQTARVRLPDHLKFIFPEQIISADFSIPAVCLNVYVN